VCKGTQKVTGITEEEVYDLSGYVSSGGSTPFALFDENDNFDPKKVAKYDERKIAQLLSDEGIIRNRLKVEATVSNAKKIKEIQKESGSFKNWLDHHHPKTKEEWVKLFKQNFRFTGGEIVNEFLMSTGYLPGAHIESCPVYKKVLKQKPAWAKKA